MKETLSSTLTDDGFRPIGGYGGSNDYLITTAIDYPNAPPHIGTAFEKIGADVQARFHRFLGRKVYFLMGNDENTVKVSRRALELGEDPKSYVNRMAEIFKAVWKSLDISYDDFIQTSEDRHKVGVQKFLQTVYDAGYVYKKAYKSPYCDGCEEFKSPKSLVGGKCPNHPTVEIYDAEEENYFFRLSAFKQFVLDLYVPTLFISTYMEILPESRLNEMKNFVASELEDISISRVNHGWGVLCPFDDSQVVYVWFDALLNYLTGVGFGTDEEKFDKWWPAHTHYIGKDITRFHCAMWPAMIAAYNKLARKPVCFPEQVFAHGFIYQKKEQESVKVSKSGAFVDPAVLVAKYGSDAYRYYFLSKFDFGGDGEYSEQHFHHVYNGELANNLGNLVSRTVGMILQYFDGVLPERGPISPGNAGLREALKWGKATIACDYRKALLVVWELLMEINKYIDDRKPWSLSKTDPVECAAALHAVVSELRLACIMLKPYLPRVAEKVYNSFDFPVRWEDVDVKYLEHVCQNAELSEIRVNRDSLIDGKYPPLFPRLEI